MKDPSTISGHWLPLLIWVSMVMGSYAQNIVLEGPSEQFQKSSAYYGIHYAKSGYLRTFDAAWDQLIQIDLPKFSDYEQIIGELKSYCLLMNDMTFAPIDPVTNKTIELHPMGVNTTGALIRACRGFERTMQITLRDLLNSAFKESLPNPSLMRDNVVDTLTNTVGSEYELPTMPVARSGYPFRGALGVQFSDILPIAPQQSGPAPELSTTTTTTETPTTHGSTSLPLIVPASGVPIDGTTGPALDAITPSPLISQNLEAVMNRANSLDDLMNRGKLGRKKRFIITGFVLACVGLLSASFGAWGMSIQNQKRMDEMQSHVTRLVEIEQTQDQESVMLRDEMIGLTSVNEHRFNFTGNTLKSLIKIQKINGAHIRETHSLLQNLSRADAVSNSIMLHLVEQQELVARVSTILETARRRIRDFEVGLVSLLNNQLSTYFLTYSKLRAILYKVKRSLPSEYQLGISTSELSAYYYFRLATFARVDDKLIIRLVIPLTVNRGYVVPEVLFQPHYNTIPVPKDFDKKGNQNFMRVYSPNNDFWTFKENFTAQVSIKHLSCHDVGALKNCIRFKPIPEIPPTKCMSKLWSGEFSPQILFTKDPNDSPCFMYEVERDTYAPIRLSDSMYVIHGSSFLSYSLECPGKPIEVLEVGEEITMTSIELDPGCVLRMKSGPAEERVFPGPIMHRYFNASIGFFQHQPILNLPRNNTRRVLFSISPVPLRQVNDTQIVYNPISVKPSVDAILNRLKRQTSDIAERLDEYNTTFVSAYGSTSSIGLLKVFQKFIFEIILLIVTLATIRTNRWIYFTAPTVVFLSDTASASVFDPVLGAFITDSATVFFYENIMSLILLMIVGFITLSYCVHNLLNRVYVSNHRGSIRSIVDTPFLLSIEFTIYRETLCYGTLQTFSILFPLRAKPEKLARNKVTSFYALGAIHAWKVRNNQFYLSEKVLCKGQDAGGNVTMDQPVPIAFDLNSVEWTTSRRHLMSWASYGTCNVRVIRNPRIRHITDMSV